MAGQLWATSTQGQYLYSPILTKEVTFAAQPDMRFVQFCQIQEEWGRSAGETFLFDKYSSIDTQGGELTETSTIPLHSYRVYQGTATIKEWGNAIPWTKKYEVLAQTNERRAVVRILADDHARVFDTAVEAEFDKCKIRYVGTATNGGVTTTDGTATATCASPLNTYHVKQIIDYMYQTMKCSPWDGDNYIAICSTDAKRGVYDDVEDILQYTKYPASGEFGRYYDCRFVKTNHALSNAIGASSAYGEAYFIGGGGGPVLRGIAEKMKVVPKEETDFGRSRGLSWQALEAFCIFYQSDPDDNIVKYDSA
jgi:N4-gp56 family major capsid protein